MQEDDDFSPELPEDDAPPEDGETPAEALLGACAAEPETDIGNGRRFRLRFGDLAKDFAGAASHIAICVAHIGWHVFDGKRWKEDEDGSLIRRLAHRTAEAIRRESQMIDASEDEHAILAAGEVAADALERMKTRRGLPEPGLVVQKRDYERAVEAASLVAQAIGARRGSRLRHAKSTAGSSKLNNLLAEGQPYMACKVQDLNTDPYIVNCLNGTVSFLQVEDDAADSGDDPPDHPRFHWVAELREHRQGDFITKMVEAEWHEDGKPPMPEFRKFLLRVQPDPEIRAFLKRFCGYLLTGLTIEQVMLFFFGAGRNGKSTFVDLFCSILGDYAVTLSIDSFSGDNKRGGGEATPDLARLPGARLVAASEPEANVKLKDALIKTLTGGEKIPVRRLHRDFFEVHPNFKIVLSGNHKPRIDDDSDGIWRRVLLVPWTVQIPAPEVDRALSRKLRAEADGIFAWMVDGAIDYLNGGLDVPAAVHAASEEYRQESDPIGTFIRMACLVTGEPADEEKPFDLYLAYDKFATEEGVFKFNAATFAKRFSSASARSWPGPEGTVKAFSKAKSGTTVYRGIKVRPEWIPSSGDRSHHLGDER